jgi:imidazolonepropionase-like amidohydrolase
MSPRPLSVLFFLLFAAAAHADAPGVYAITGGTVHPVSGPEIANGIVIIRNGLIEAVGANVAVPPDATVIDAKGSHVYPGLFDAQTTLGLPAAAPRRTGFGGGGGAAAARTTTPPPPEPTPAYQALREVKLSEEDVDAKRATGVTTIVTASAGGIFNGQSAILNLGEGDIASRVIRAPASQQISFNTRPTWTYPDSLMGVIAFIRQAFMDTQQYTAAHAIYDRNPAGLKRPDDSLSAQALESLMRRDVPAVFIADSESMMRRAQAIAREFNLRYILAGARQAYRMPDDLKGVPVLVSVKWPEPPANKDDREDQPLRIIRDRQLSPTTPSVLAKSGVTFALVTGAAGKTSDFLPGIRKAIDNGLSGDDALRAVTLTPARIFGVDRQLGSLDRGKIANVIVSDKPIFTKDAKVKRVYIDGREIRLPEEPPKRGEGAEAASPVEGTWNLTVKSSQGDVNIIVTLHVESGKISGTFSGDRGSGEIRGGSVDGSTVDFTISAQAQAETSDWVFRGTLRDSTMEGTVSTTQGTFPFTGSKSR